MRCEDFKDKEWLEWQKENIRKAQNRLRVQIGRKPETEQWCREELKRLKRIKEALNKHLAQLKDYSGQEAYKMFGKRFKDLTDDEKKEYSKAIVYKSRNKKKEQTR